MLRTTRLLAALTAVVLVPLAPARAADSVPEPVDPAQHACPPEEVQSAGFTDVPPGDGFALAIDCLAGYGIAHGTGNGEFGRSAPVSRAQMALFLDRVTAYALQASESTATRDASDAGFDDLAGQPQAVVDAVNRLANEGVVDGSDGDGDGRPSYRPRDSVSRGQMAAFLRRELGALETLLTGTPSDGPSSTSDYFDDDEGSVFEPDINAVAGAGLTGGVGPATYAPEGTVSRQQMAVFLARVLEVEVRDGRFPSRYADGGRPLDGSPDTSPAVPGTPTTVARGLSVPWGLAVLPDGVALVSERDTARLRLVHPDGRVTDIGTVPGVVHGGEGGLLGVAVSPSFATDRMVYAYLTTGSDNRVVRTPFDAVGSEVQTLVSGIPKASVHNGGRIAFGPDGMLYIGTGDAADRDLAQNPASLAGKVLRVRPDGSVPEDNPFAGSPVFTLGHRNVQGLGFDDAGRLFASELGQNTFDEVNVLRAGGNYGWPVVEGRGGDSRFVDPVVTWSPAEASPSGAVVADGSFWVAALRGQRLWQVVLDGTGGVRDVVPHFVGEFGRLRAVAQVPDGSLWVLTNEADARVLRVPLS
jgi:glucose/arabinose dehydrogenase